MQPKNFLSRKSTSHSSAFALRKPNSLTSECFGIHIGYGERKPRPRRAEGIGTAASGLPGVGADDRLDVLIGQVLRAFW